MNCKIPQMALTLTEKVKLQKALAEHQVYCPTIKNSCNYSIEFESAGGGIGISISMICSICKKKYDITDYGTW